MLGVAEEAQQGVGAGVGECGVIDGAIKLLHGDVATQSGLQRLIERSVGGGIVEGAAGGADHAAAA